MSTGVSGDPALSRTMRGEEMLQAEEVAAMMRLHALGWGAKRLSKEFGCAQHGSALPSSRRRGAVQEARAQIGFRRTGRVVARSLGTAAMPMSCARNWRASMGS